MMPAARLVCQRPSSNFRYFRTPLANFLLSRPNSVEYGNSKTTTLLPSAKCTRPLFQCRTGCDGRPSGWHDIVTCQRLVVLFFCHFLYCYCFLNEIDIRPIYISIMYLIQMTINNVYYFYLKFLLVSPCSNTSLFVVIHNFFQQNLVTTIALRSVAAAVTASPSVGLSGNTST